MNEGTEVKRKLIHDSMNVELNVGESLMLQEYLEEQLLTPIRSYVKVRQDLEARGS